MKMVEKRIQRKNNIPKLVNKQSKESSCSNQINQY